MTSDTCSYCRKPLTPSHTFSYGVPGVPRVFGCNRWWCRHVTRKIAKSRRIRAVFTYLRAVVDALLGRGPGRGTER